MSAAARIPVGEPTLIKIAFQHMMLMCDALTEHSPKHLRLCISMLGQFRQQANMNTVLTASESLFWGVSDVIQVKWHEAV